MSSPIHPSINEGGKMFIPYTITSVYNQALQKNFIGKLPERVKYIFFLLLFLTKFLQVTSRGRRGGTSREWMCKKMF